MAAVTSPRVKQKVIIMIHPSKPLNTVVQIMLCGKVIEASRSSSDMCTAASAPSNGSTAGTNPTSAETPVELQPPKLLNCVKTLCASPRGPKTQSGMMMPKKPKTWMIRTRASIKGSFLASTVLKKIPKPETTKTGSVPCHRSKT